MADPPGVENTEGGGGGGSGHKASFRGANKLARRARSFKEDLLERISAMRSPGAPSTHTALPSLRSQSPLSSKGRNQQKDDPESNPSRDLELLVRQVKCDLKHFGDVILKKKLEMLPGNGTIVLDTITNIHTAVRPYVPPLGAFPSAKLGSALTRLCQALADLIRLCDKSMIAGENCAALDKANVQRITEEVQKAVEDLAKIAVEEIAENNNAVHLKSNGTTVKEPKNLKLQPRPAADVMRISSNDSQRNSLPDIPLTPHERQILEGVGNGFNIRSSHSTESILDSVSPQEPPPKPPIPIRSLVTAPPLPPKKKPVDSCHLSATDRSSLQSHSSGSLDSMLNVSNDEEIRAIMDRNSTNFDDSLPMSIDGTIAPLNNRLSLESNSTLDTSSNICANNNHLSNEMIPHSSQIGDIYLGESAINPNINQHRFSSESGFVSMGNTRNSEISYSSFNSSSLLQHQKSSLSYIDSTPTPSDLPSSMLTDLINNDKCQIVSSNKVLDVSSMANVVQHSMKEMSSKRVFGVYGRTFTTNESFNSSMSTNTVDIQKTSVQSFAQKNSTQAIVIDQSNTSSKVSVSVNNTSFSSENSDTVQISSENNVSTDVCDSNSLPPALPVKTRINSKLGFQNDNLSDHSLFNSSIDDQTIEFRDRITPCPIHCHADGMMQRPHTLMDQSCSQPPPLPIKKKHIMAYMEMFGNCSHSPQSSTEFLRHSVHAYNSEHSASHFVSSSQFQQLTNASFGLNNSQNGQSIVNNVLGCNQQLTQSHTLHHFSISSGGGNNNQQTISGFSSPLKSPNFIREDSIKSDASSINSLSTNSSNLPVNAITSSIPPALPPKKIKAKQTPNHSPAKPPLSPKPPLVTQTGTSSPTTPGPLTCTTPNGRISTSPAPRFQFDPPSVIIENALLLNAEDDQWQQNANKPGKFPVEDLDLEPRTNASSSPSSRDADPSLETETENEPDIILELDVSARLVRKRPTEDGPEIRGGNPDALIVHAIKCTKDFSYQEAFLTTYRTFVSPLNLIEKLNRRHAFLARHGQNTKAREVQSLLTRIVGDLTMADMDNELMVTIMDFVYGLVCSGDLAMAKVLRVIILEKYKAKQLALQQQQSLAAGLQWTATVSARRDSVLEQKAEAVAEQMTLLDAELFTRIPPPEALLWARDQCEETSPNLTRFTEHFNKMSYWARSRILEQEEARDREKYVSKFIKVMKHLRKMNNFNSYLALLSALDSAPIRRLDWQKHIIDGLKEYCALIDSSSSFRAYRQALAETQPPCIPYIGLVLQDLTFVHIGNSDLLQDGSINFSKRWQQYHILENMKRFSKAQYTFKKNERIIAMFNGFDDVLNEEAMWQISEAIKPRGSRKNNSNS
ncbi:guanine nucleotide-releasing factor 2-like isoform X2 [Arctopsyche grandis]|uniref:guanine nucleotide-releasing factor 2-like isoform X2 n=1 Tax=Arctopsyche grandis TaxID=121162 RepID=UPI00406D8AC4